MRRVAVVGMGYVGAVVAGSLASIGNEVVGIETDPRKLDSMREGIVPFHEPGLEELLGSQLARGALSITDSYEDALDGTEVTFLCVGTPALADGSPDTTHVAAAAEAIAGALTGPMIVVTKSTVPIGSGRWLLDRMDHGQVAVVSNPEFLREGSAIQDFLHPDRVVLGTNDPVAMEAITDLYRPILEQSFTGGRPDHRPGLVQTDLETAEIVKYAANAFLAMKISFINEVAAVADAVGADITEVATAIGMDQRIGSPFLGAGIGWGGSCFGKDLAALHATARAHGLDSLITQAVVEVNDRQIEMVAAKLRRHLEPGGSRIALLGLAFKPGTDDLRDAPSLKLARRLLDEGAQVVAFDPVVDAVADEMEDLEIATSWEEAVGGADATVVVTEWNEFLAIDLVALAAFMKGSVFVDARNAFDIQAATAAGLTYIGIGRGSR